jgi:hypothetical protein
MFVRNIFTPAIVNVVLKQITWGGGLNNNYS